MIRAYVGRLGSGKSLSMVADAAEDFRLSHRQVYTCMTSLCFPGQSYFDIESIGDLCELSQGIILLDEAQIGLSARSFTKTPERVLSALAQLRKNGLDLYLTTQHIEKVEKQLRQLVNEVVNCRMLAGGRVRLNRATDENLGEAKERRRALWWRMRRIDPRVYELYDTYEVMGSLQANGIAVADWLAAHRASPRRSGRGAGFPSRFDPPWVSWKDGRPRVRMVPESFAIWEELVERGVLDRASLDLRAVAAEGRRRRWLAYFGLDWELVPSSVTMAHPWAEGGSPACVLGERAVEPKRGARR